MQLLASVATYNVNIYRDRKNPTKVEIHLTKSQYIEFTEKWTAYSEAWEKYISDKEEIALHAFIVANDIFDKNYRNDKPEEERSFEELKRLRKVHAESRNIDPTVVRKLLS